MTGEVIEMESGGRTGEEQVAAFQHEPYIRSVIGCTVWLDAASETLATIYRNDDCYFIRRPIQNPYDCVGRSRSDTSSQRPDAVIDPGRLSNLEGFLRAGFRADRHDHDDLPHRRIAASTGDRNG